MKTSAMWRAASKIGSLPVLNLLSPHAGDVPSAEEIEKYRAAQLLAKKGAKAIAALVQDGWTESQTADLFEAWLHDHGVKAYFHKPFVWFGERTRFDGVKTYWDYQPTNRVVRPGEVMILDVAPIVDGYICDIGHTTSLGVNDKLSEANDFLEELKRDLPKLAAELKSGAAVWKEVDRLILEAGYENIHSLYPFSVLGHRVHKVGAGPDAAFIHFGWQSYWAFLSRGLFGQLWNQNFAGSLRGLWAIEPHIGTRGEGTKRFGAKFEEILVVGDGWAKWIEELK